MRIEFLRKDEADSVLPKLFAILHANMSRIAPTGNSYDEDLSFWISCVAPALEKEPRQIVLLKDEEMIAGYFQYYVNDGVFMMEEIQFRDEYKGSGLFAELFTWLTGIIPKETKFVEAYAHKNNEKSIAVLSHLGLEIIGENKNGICYHFRGNYEKLTDRYKP